MNVQARVAHDGDSSEIASIRAILASEIENERGGAVHLAELAIETRDPNPESNVEFVGSIDDVVVGFVALRILEMPSRSMRVGEVVDYGVLEDARGVGVGEAMLDLVVEHCRQHQCTGIDATALPGERETKNFFETFGFTARKLVVHRRL